MNGMSVNIKIGLPPAGGNVGRIGRALGDFRQPLRRIGLFGERHSRDRLKARITHQERSTGMLIRSGHSELSDDQHVNVGYNAIYARIQQLGGVVTPNGHPYLAIPVPDWLARAGQWPRDWPRGMLRFHPHAWISLLGATWFGPALVVADKSAKTKQRESREEINQRYTARKAKEKKTLGFVRQGTKDAHAEELAIARGGSVARAISKSKGLSGHAAKVEQGEVMYALARKVRIPADPYLEWDAPWATFSHETLSKHLGFAA